jgi:soluble lytic murein transglycosylase-like protein
MAKPIVTREELTRRHGTPDKFAIAVYLAVPGVISVDEAKASVEKYRREWEAAPTGEET